MMTSRRVVADGLVVPEVDGCIAASSSARRCDTQAMTKSSLRGKWLNAVCRATPAVLAISS